MDNQIWFQKFRIIKLLGHGGSAEVYLAEHIKLKSLRAIKKISKNNILHEQLLHEAFILKNLKHSCIPIIYDFEEDAHNSYIIEQYIEGESLKVFREQFEHFPEPRIIDITIQICDLIQYLYSYDNPILYLDLKPDNLIISDGIVKLIDFGASSYKNQLSQRKYSIGTKGYAAPELYSNRMPNERTDIYGIGCLIYFMMTGRSYDIHTFMQSRKEMESFYSKSLLKITEQCLRSYPFFRYASVNVLKNKLFEQNQKRPKAFQCTGKSLCFGVAGTQHRIGTTHLAILISAYFTAMGKQALYIEKNNSNHVTAILNRYKGVKSVNGIYQLHHCSMYPTYNIELSCNVSDYKITVIDYGCLSEENLSDFLQADIKLIVAGAKDWELDEAENALKLLNDCESIKYLFNFIGGNQFRDIVKQMDPLPCYRIPYEPNPFKWKRSECLEVFMNQIVDT